MVAALVIWACALVVLGFVDARQFVLPTALVHAAAVATCCLLVATGICTGDWRYLSRGLECSAVAGAAFGTWSMLKPASLGFGDVRMACLVALGAGALSPAAALVALSCAPLAAGISARRLARRLAVASGDDPAEELAEGPAGRPGRRAGRVGAFPVPLGPFLAVGGIAAVLASAR
jgi:leader peptidase (prepilin peptidase)/N-methyltransferase